MRQEVIDFYEKKRVPIEKMIAVATRRGYSPESIRQAADDIYEDIRVYKLFGAEIEQIRLAWKVYNRASKVAVQQKREEDHRIEDLKALTNRLTDSIESLKEQMVPWYQKLWRKFNDN